MSDAAMRARTRLLAALRELESAIEEDASFSRESSLRTPSSIAAEETDEGASDDLLAGYVARLDRGAVATRHPRYFGPPHPAPAPIAVVARALAATLDPQLATRSHAPWPIDVEATLLREIGERFGFARDDVEGTFTQGGAESNAIAVVCAATSRLPAFATSGVRASARSPTIYASAEAHATIVRAARLAGLGDASVRHVPVDAAGRLKVPALRSAIARDVGAGHRPFAVVATVGTTSEGAIDPLAEIADVAEANDCWLHADAAWGGLLAFVPERARLISSLARADSVTFDPHKALPIPLGVGVFVTRRRGAMPAAFAIEAGYMPPSRGVEPHASAPAWSRRFAGLELRAVVDRVGWDGIGASLRRQLELADRLRAALRGDGWRVVNETPLPNVCFIDAPPAGERAVSSARIARAVVESGSAWISAVKGANGRRSLRACVGNPTTRAEDVDALVAALADARARCRSPS